MKKYFFIYLLCIFSFSHAQQTKKSVKALRAPKPPTIDGVLNEPFWDSAEVAKNFVMYQPGDGTPERENKKSEVRVVYDDVAIYFGATFYDDEPNKIPLQFTSRDEFGNTDLFTISINPLNNGQDDTQFIVMSTGAQADLKIIRGNEDLSWNAVWDNEVTITKNGWVAEIRIPYSALRFDNTPIQTWGINFVRKINYLNEEYVWNYVDRSIGEFSMYSGDLSNLENIVPPTRLSFFPYASTTYGVTDGDEDLSANIGLDIRYGLSENFTIDATLIPDFGQTAFDDQVLNLGPFEQAYSEKRAFFTEGTDLFDKGNLFYSRRIGNTPTGYSDVEENLEEDETIVENPSKVNMINAIKLSGRTKKGLGIGVFNAITERTYAKVKDTITGDVREELTEPLTNYNVFVIDQQYNKNSSVSFVNTNVLREGSFRDANTSAILFDLKDKGSKYNIYGNVKMSNVREDSVNTSGYSAFLRLAKISGNYQYSIAHFRSDENYDIKDLGFQRRNNYSNFNARGSYQIFEPTKHFNKYKIELEASLRYLNSPNVFTSSDIELDAFFMTHERFAFGIDMEVDLGDIYDYNEPRTDGRFIKQNGVIEAGAFISSDYRKKFALDANLAYASRYDSDNYFNGIELEPRFRFSNKFSMIYSIEYGKMKNEKGYVTTLDNEDIIFGERDIKNITNALSGKLSFNTNSFLSLTFRHYWSPVQYEDNYYVLNEDGTLSDSTYSENNDINYNIWNLDLNYSWQFAPGSFLIALYRNSIFNEDDLSHLDFRENLNNLFQEPMTNIFSLKVVYYLDYNNLKSWL